MRPARKIRGFLLHGWLEQSGKVPSNYAVAGQQLAKSQECLSWRDTANKGTRHNIPGCGAGSKPRRDQQEIGLSIGATWYMA